MWAPALLARGRVIFTNLVSFDVTKGANPYAGLVQDAAGNLYGTTSAGGDYGKGTVFRVTSNGALASLASFSGTNGANPLAALVQGDDGNFYGTTSAGGTNDTVSGGDGTLFRLTTNGALTTLLSFNNVEGAAPQGPLTQGSDGNFYGTTSAGGTNDLGDGGDGTVFEFSTNGALRSLFMFNGTNGSAPACELVQGVDGNLYGTTSAGGPAGSVHHLGEGRYGAVFRIGTNGILTNLVFFDGTNGTYPYAGLVLGADGVFYSTASAGGAAFNGSPLSGDGTVFKVTTNGALTTLVSFNGTNGTQPMAGLVPGPEGNFYGTTEYGGVSNLGTVFRITSQGALFTLFSFSGTNGALPTAGLTLGTDGNFYGATAYGGAGYNGNPLSGYGTVFRLSVPMAPVFQSVRQTNGRVTFTWSAAAGQTYQLQYSDDLTRTNWLNFGGSTTATNSTMTASDIIGSNAQRFYRAVLLP